MTDRADDHHWSQQHLSHYVEGDLRRRARRRVGQHAQDCADCGRGIQAMRALLRLFAGIEGGEAIRAPAGIFDRLRAGGGAGPDGNAASAPSQGA